MSSPHQPDVGAQIRKARKASGLSQVDFAKQLRQAERTIQAWEANERTPRLPNLVELAQHVGLPVDFFYGTDDVPEAEEAA